MEFNEHWTKQDNDLMRKMFKEGKSHKDVIDFFGKEKVKYHPTKKFSTGGALPDFTYLYIQKMFNNEIKNTYTEIEFKIATEPSKKFLDRLDYTILFDDCIIKITYVEDGKSPFPNKSLYHISIPILDEYSMIDYLKYETIDNINDVVELMKKILYVINKINLHIESIVDSPIYCISVNDIRNITSLYINIMEYSLPMYKSNWGDSSNNFGNDMIYYYKK